jgi:hypothetical protein
VLLHLLLNPFGLDRAFGPGVGKFAVLRADLPDNVLVFRNACAGRSLQAAMAGFRHDYSESLT